MHARFETSWSLLFVWCAQSKGEKFAELCRAVAMQVAASPTVDFVKSSDISDAVKEQERRLEMQAEDLAGKPDDIKAKMVEGRLGKILKTKVVVKPRIKKTAENLY
jgi:elongation factor Ts